MFWKRDSEDEDRSGRDDGLTVPSAVRDYYTDFLCHAFEPDKGGQRIAVGSTTGLVRIIERNWDNNEAYSLMESELPNGVPVLGLDWGPTGVFVGSKSVLQMYRPDPFGHYSDGLEGIVKFDCGYELQDVAAGPQGSTVFAACDDCKVRAWDVETQRLKMEFADHKLPVQVCKVNNEYLVSGGEDGKIILYDASLRSPKPVTSFDQGKTIVTALDICNKSTWVATGSLSSPVVYNLKSQSMLPRIPVEGDGVARVPKRIYTVHFDHTNTLWWGGSGGRIYKSADLTTVLAEIQAAYGESTIYHVYSISTTAPKRLSVVGSSTGILFSDNSEFWDGMVHL